jgi:integrase
MNAQTTQIEEIGSPLKTIALSSRSKRTGRRRVRFKIRKITNAGGSVAYVVTGMLGFQQIRRRFATEQEAQTEQSRLFQEHHQRTGGLQSQVTRLTAAELKEAELATTLIRQRYPDRPDLGLLAAARFFCERHFLPETIHTLTSIESIYLKAREGQIGNVQYKTIRITLRRLARGFPNEKLHEITTPKILAWMNREFGGAAPKTWNIYRGDIAAFFNWCASQEPPLIPKNPMLKIQSKHKPHKIPCIVTAATAAAVMRDVELIDDGRYALIVALMLFAGIRPDGEMKRIAAHVALAPKPDPNVLVFEEHRIFLGSAITKTKIPRWIPLPANLVEWLRVYPPVRENLAVKSFLAGPYPKLRKTHAIGHDAFRHSFCSYLGKLRGSAFAAQVAGHIETIQKNEYENMSMTDDEVGQFFEIVPARR